MVLGTEPVTLHSGSLFVAVAQISRPSFYSCSPASVVFPSSVTVKVICN